MSIVLMTAAFKATLHSTHKFVLLALCDSSNDQGQCFPSIAKLSKKTSLSDRAVQKSIAYLMQEKYLRRDTRSGRSSYYFIADPRTWFTSEQSSPPNVDHPTPEPHSPPPPNGVHPTPEYGSPITIKEPLIESSRNQHKRGIGVKSPFSPIDDLLERGVNRQTAKDWLALRKNKNAAVTKTAIDGVAKQADTASLLLEDALKICCERGWAGFNAEWILQKRPALAPTKQSRHSGFEKTDYSDGVTASGYLS